MNNELRTITHLLYCCSLLYVLCSRRGVHNVTHQTNYKNGIQPRFLWHERIKGLNLKQLDHPYSFCQYVPNHISLKTQHKTYVITTVHVSSVIQNGKLLQFSTYYIESHTMRECKTILLFVLVLVMILRNIRAVMVMRKSRNNWDISFAVGLVESLPLSCVVVPYLYIVCALCWNSGINFDEILMKKLLISTLWFKKHSVCNIFLFSSEKSIVFL